MHTVNPATQVILNIFIDRASSLPLDQHPYGALNRGLGALGKSEFGEEEKKAAIAAMSMWIMSTAGSAIADALNEILAVMRHAHGTGDEGKKLAEELAKTMPFLEKVVEAFLREVDIRYVAETLFEDGMRRQRAGQTNPINTDRPPEQKAPAEDPQPMFIKQIKNWLPSRFKPSAN